MNLKEYSLASYCKIENGAIIYAEFKKSIRVDIEAAREIVASRLEFADNKDHFLIADMSKVRVVTAEAKEYLQRSEGGLKNILAAALIASNPVAALIANIFVKTPKGFPARFFWNKQDAITWMQEHITNIETTKSA